MAHYIAYAGKSRAAQPRQMMDEVKGMLALGLWAIPSTTMLRDRLLPGDGLIIAVGTPYRRFVADAVVGSRYRAFTSSEVHGLPAGFALDHGVSLTRVRVWQKRPWIDEVWPRTSASRNNQRAQFRQGITSIASSDAAVIIAGGVDEPQGPVSPLPNAPISEGESSGPGGTATKASSADVAAEPEISVAGNRDALPAHPSDSSVQRLAESAILAAVSAKLGVILAPRTLGLPGGSRVDVDGAAADYSVFVEAFARQGALKGGQQNKVCQDALKLITIARVHPGARLIIAFADREAAAYASRAGWVAEALATWGVEVMVVDLDQELRARIRAAQLRQVMLNPAPTPGRIPGPSSLSHVISTDMTIGFLAERSCR